jgi:hypothetical protein
MEIFILSLPLLGGILFAITTADITFNVTASIVLHKNYDPKYLMHYLRSHVLERVAIIFGIGVVGQGVPVFNVPPIDGVSFAATLGLVLYAFETLESIWEAYSDTKPV